MGNAQNSGRSHDRRSSAAAGSIPDEPLEAYLREKQRNDHLKNLGLKRHTSFRKSISKKLKRHKKQPQNHSDAIEVTDGNSSNNKSQPCDVHEEQPFRRPSYNSGSQPNLSTKVLFFAC